MKPTKTVNLDEIYVKKPCIGEELSGRVIDLFNKIDLLSGTIEPNFYIEEINSDFESIDL